MFDEPPPSRPYTVSQLTGQIKTILEGSLLLKNVTVTGEISEAKQQAGKGHWYFTLKDGGSALPCVMWKSSAERQSEYPKSGGTYILTGRVGVYEPQGKYQFYVDSLRPDGLGERFAQLERLKQTLSAEGLTAEDRKRALPIIPWRIGIVTSPDAAALQDVLNVLRRRFPLADVILSPSLVQGATAPDALVRALRLIDIPDDFDVLLLVRGGGSIEDLWCFNDERVARAVAACKVPIVTGVGHETDTTLVDFVSDYRAPTPSAAAEIITRHVADLAMRLRATDDYLHQLMQQHAEIVRRSVLDATARLASESPAWRIDRARQQVDTQADKAAVKMHSRLELAQLHVKTLNAALDAADPRALLRRGYALVTSDSGHPIRSVNEVATGDAVRIELQDGLLNARIEPKE